jgi:DNA (cytosine-5)-methyltransferase 1
MSKKIKVGSDFSGVGAFNQALMRLGIDYEEIFACDMDKFARQTFIHNYGEPKYYPTNVYDREIPEESLDIYMTSPPCQSFSLAGKRQGKDDSKGRGILFFNSYEFIQKNKPRFFIFENVKGLLSDDGGKTFSEWINMLGGKSVNGLPVLFPYDESVPYHVYWKVLNAKEHGVPQNRERVFIIGIRDDKDNTFTWPTEEYLVKRLKDILEEKVDDKYFLSEKMINGFLAHNKRHIEEKNQDGFNWKPKDENQIANCLRANAALAATDNTIKVGFVNQDTQASTVYSEDGLSQTMTAGTHGYAMGYIQVKSATSKGFEEATENDSINFSVPNSETRRGRVGKGVAQTLDTQCNQGVMIGAFRGRNLDNPSDRTTGLQTEQRLEININGTSNTLTSVQKDNVVVDNYKIRRLTPRECFRLMDFPDTFDFSVVSDSQAYKQAGNSIVVRVLEKIISKLPL